VLGRKKKEQAQQAERGGPVEVKNARKKKREKNRCTPQTGVSGKKKGGQSRQTERTG